jgi:hypothetical protein
VCPSSPYETISTINVKYNILSVGQYVYIVQAGNPLLYSGRFWYGGTTLQISDYLCGLGGTVTVITISSGLITDISTCSYP